MMAWEKLVRKGQFDAIPESFCWEKSAAFAHLIDGYANMGDSLGALANERLQAAEKQGVWRGTTRELLLCLFFEHRRWRHFGEYPKGNDLKLLDDLCRVLREQLFIVQEYERVEILKLLAGPNRFAG
jgi:hypothetical protein